MKTFIINTDKIKASVMVFVTCISICIYTKSASIYSVVILLFLLYMYIFSFIYFVFGFFSETNIKGNLIPLTAAFKKYQQQKL